MKNLQISGRNCVYCGSSVEPRLFPSGRTSHLDHFIPKRVLAIARKYHAMGRVQNYLLPACQRCNNFAGQNVFVSGEVKVAFVRARTGLSPGECFRVPQIEAREFFSIVRPIEDLLPGRAYIIPCPAKVGGTWRIEERIIPLCGLTTHFMELSKTGRLYSQATSPA
jgi:hypothetical protein